MFSQGSFNSQSGQGPQAPRPLPYTQPPSQNFQQGPLQPLPQAPPLLHPSGLPMYRSGPLGPHFAVRQVPPGGMPNTGQLNLHPPPTAHRGAPLPHMYTTAQPKLQHSSYIAPGPPPPPPRGPHNTEILQAPRPPRTLPPPPSQGSLYRAPLHQMPPQPGGVQGLHQIPLHVSTSNFCGNSQVSCMVPPPPPPSSSLQPIPPSFPPTVSSPASISMPSPAGSLFPEGGSGCDVDNLGEDGLSSKRGAASVNPPPPPPPKPSEEKLIQRIEELCQLIAKNGPPYEDMTLQKEFKNPEFSFLFGGELGSEAAIAHEYFLWMKKRYLLACKLDEIVPAIPTNHLAVTTEHNASIDSDMEMEDDITESEMDQPVNQPIEGGERTTDPITSRVEAKEQLHSLSRSTRAEAAPIVLSDTELLSCSSQLGEQGSKLVSSLDDDTSGGSDLRNQGQVIISAGDAEFPNASYEENSSSEPFARDKSFSRTKAAALCITSVKSSCEAMKGSSPFRLLQDYASNDSLENDEDPCLEDADPQTVSPLVANNGDNVLRDTGLSFKTVRGSKSPYRTEKGIWLLPESGILCSAPDLSTDSQRKTKEAVLASVASGSDAKQIDTKHENQSCVDCSASHKAPMRKDTSGGACANVAFTGNEKDNEDKRVSLPLNAPKIDKFGRLVREGATDSDSDDSRYARRQRRRGRSRSRSRSRSPSPLGRRRRWKRSPRRRREKRSRSQSWSPRNQRSRSRSPSSRHADYFSSSNRRRNKRQMPECFDFLRGKCYRGASCRFMHHGSDKSEGSRHYRSEQKYALHPPHSEKVHTHEDNKKLSTKALYHEQETINQEVQYNQDISGLHGTKDDTNFQNREDSGSITLVDSLSHREVASEVPETKVVQEQYVVGISCLHENFQEAMDSDQVVVYSFPSNVEGDARILRSHGEASKDVHPPLKDSVVQQSQLSNPLPAQQSDDSSISDSSQNQAAATSPKTPGTSDALLNAADSANKSSQWPTFPTSGPNTESNNAPQMTQPPRDYSLIPQTAAFQSKSAPSESFASYMLPNQSSLFSVPLPVSLPLPSPPPLPLLRPHVPILNVRTSQTGDASQFHYSGLPPRSDFGSQLLRPYSTELSGNSQVGDFQHQAYPPLHKPQPSFLLVEGGSKPQHRSNPSDKELGGNGLLGEDHLKRLAMQEVSASDAFPQSSNYPQPGSFLQESHTTKVQYFSVDKVPPGEILKSSSQVHPHLQRQPPFDLPHSVLNSVYGMPEKISSSSRYPADLQDKNRLLHLPDFGVARSSAHFNPYASTFEKPLSSRFSSDVFKSERDTTCSNMHEHHPSLSHVPIDELGIGSRHATSSPIFARAVGRVLSRSGNDQYDPLFDSIEPSSGSYKKPDQVKKWEPCGMSDAMLRLKSSNQPLDMEENNKKKEVGGIVLASCPDNEEFGETADAEVGDVENGSQSNDLALANTDMGEMEIDQIKSPGKNKKSKESRSMKLFKVCLAEFVKEVLKPSWRQGNMSKETFKTVVKKAVDKVSGAMESHQIPKSKVKINQYIDSSQRKLTKLVMGYVDKYAKG